MRGVWRHGAEVMKAVEKKEGWEKIDGIIEKLSGAHVEERGDNPVPVSARDLADIPPPASLWADIIYPGCIVQLNSEPGAGKSTLAYNICALGRVREAVPRYPVLEAPQIALRRSRDAALSA